MSSSELPTRARTSDTRATTRRRQPREAPLVLERYRLHRRLGAGAFGTVWHARDERLDREVAIKIMPRERIIDGRFEREAKAAARLAHPGIVTLYEAAMDDDDAYLVSELVRGSTLAALLEAGRLSDRDVVAIGIGLCDALAHAHGEGVIHRDIKPANVLIPAHPSTPAEVAKLTDFGVARVVGGDSLTRTGDIVGTAAYMSPEQAEGRPASETADVYSLALVLYEALSGVNPVRVVTAGHHARRLAAYLPALRRQRRDLPRELGQCIDLALRPRPRERGTIEELGEGLREAHQQVQDRPGIVTGPRLRADSSVAAPGPDRRRTPQEEHRTGRRDSVAARGDRVAPVATPGDGAARGIDLRTRPLIGWRSRALMAGAAALLGAWLTRHLLPDAPLPPAAVGLIAAATLLILPRLGWIGLTGAFSAAAVGQDRPGLAILFMLAALAPVVLLPRSPAAWPLSAGAPALGLVGLAGMWPAVAAGARRPWQRATLGAGGWIWLVVAQSMTGRSLYLHRLPGMLDANAWGSAPYDTVHHVLVPVLSSGVMAPAIAWALGALTLPWVARGRSLTADVVLVTIWAATVTSATSTLLRAAGAIQALPSQSVAVAGALASAVVALSPTMVRAWRMRSESAKSASGLA